jgi:UDP-2,4-diacetamido-2,4,6-trideoxy-beta-L-altropyranose hydrolase
MRAVFRADASPTIGGGHVMRCLTLADGLAARGWTCAFATVFGTPETVPTLAASGHCVSVLVRDSPDALRREWPEGVDLLVVDHYGRDAAYERACRPWARRILVIDDLADRPHDADLLLDQTFGRDPADYRALVPVGCRLLAGSDHALLRPAFARARPAALDRRAAGGGVARLLVALGMGDPDDATGVVLDGIARAGLDVAVDVVLGGRAPHLEAVRRRAAALPRPGRVLCDVADMAGLMAAADLAVGAGGTTSWERGCLGLPTLILNTADNQEKIARELAAAGAVLLLGRHPGVAPDAVADALAGLAADPERRRAMSRAAAALCDGLGVERALKEIMK